MSAIIDDASTCEYLDIGKRVLSQLKTYTFLVYYQTSHLESSSKSIYLEKLSFKLKQDKNQHSDKYGQYSKNVQLIFYAIENDNEVSNSLHDLKVSGQESKTKLIFFCCEAQMVELFFKAKCANIAVENIPICIYTGGIHADCSRFLGWGQPNIRSLHGLSVTHIESDVRKWVESPAEKIDIWALDIQVSQEGGSIEKLCDQSNNFLKFKQHSHRELFLSSMSIGYHPQLLLQYQQRKTSKESSLLNKMVYSFEGLKKFCCVGDADMRESTGIVKVDFVDEKGGHQIMRYLRDLERDEESEYLAKSKPSNKKKVLSIVLANINRFFGGPLKGNEDSKMNDQKLELFTFQSINDCTRISSVGGQINIQFTPDQPVYVQVNDSCFRLVRPLSLRVQSFGKAKIIINKETLNC